MLRQTLRISLALTLFAAALVGCGERERAGPPASDAPAAAEPRFRAVATVAMIGDAVRAVAGDDVEVESLIGPGVDPHLFRPTSTDMQRLLRADVVFANGLQLEGKMLETFAKIAESGKKVYFLAERVNPALVMRDGESADSPPDPHLWMDPLAWVAVTAAARDALGDFDRIGSPTYTRHADEYTEKVRALHEYAKGVLSTVPPDRRVLVTSHDAFGYFGARYGFEVVGIQGISTESEAGLRDIQRIVDMIVERKVPSVFTESTVSDRSIRAIIEGARAKGHSVAIGGTLFSDAMGPAGTYEGTYLGMIDHNVTTIARALGGTAPERGMAGRLGAPRAGDRE